MARRHRHVVPGQALPVMPRENNRQATFIAMRTIVSTMKHWRMGRFKSAIVDSERYLVTYRAEPGASRQAAYRHFFEQLPDSGEIVEIRSTTEAGSALGNDRFRQQYRGNAQVQDPPPSAPRGSEKQDLSGSRTPAP